MFPTLNANNVAKRFVAGTNATTLGSVTCGLLASGPMNFLSVPAVVDVSGMEYSIGVFADNAGADGLAAQSASIVSLALSDGGATGDATAVAVLATAITNSTTAWTSTIPRDVTGTSATDLDADDWINFHVTTQAATVAGAGQVDVAIAFIYGKPGALA